MEDLRVQVKRLEESNAALTTRNAELTREVSRIPPLRSNIEELKNGKAALVRRHDHEPLLHRCQTTARAWHHVLNPPPRCTWLLQEVRVAELESSLAAAKAEAVEMRSALTVAMESQAVAAAAAVAASVHASASGDSLGAELAAMMGSGAGGDGGDTGITSGVSEYNPQVAAKIARLEQEVAELRAGGSGASASEVATLSGQLDDMRRMKAVYEAKYSSVSGCPLLPDVWDWPSTIPHAFCAGCDTHHKSCYPELPTSSCSPSPYLPARVGRSRRPPRSWK